MERQNALQRPYNLPSDAPLERHIRELLALHEIGQALWSRHDLDDLLHLAIERVVTLLASAARANCGRSVFRSIRASPGGSSAKGCRWWCRMPSKIHGGTIGSTSTRG